MNLTQRQKTEELRTREQHSKLVKGLLDEGISIKDIVKISDVEELGLDKETIKEILAYHDARKKSMKKMGSEIYSTFKWTGKILYTPFKARRDLYDRLNYDCSANVELPYVLSSAGYVLGNLLVAAMLPSPTSAGYYSLFALGAGITNGIYERYRHVRNKMVKEKISELEQISQEKEESAEPENDKELRDMIYQ